MSFTSTSAIPWVLFHLETAAAHPVPFLVTLHALPKHAASLDTLPGWMLREAGWVVAISEAIMADLKALAPCPLAPTVPGRATPS